MIRFLNAWIGKLRQGPASAKLAMLVAPPLVAFFIFAAWFFPGRQRIRFMEEQAAAAAEAIITQIKTEREYYASVIVPRLDNMNADIRADYHRSPTAFPLPATMLREIGEMVSRSPAAYRVRLVSPWPINKQRGAPDDFQKEAFQSFVQTDRIYSRQDVVEGRPVMRFIAPDRATAQSCVVCHNAHPDSPKRDFQFNDLIGGIEVIIPLEAPLQLARQDQLLMLGWGIGVGITVLALIVWGTRQIVTKPVQVLTAQVEKVALSGGDLSGGELSEALGIPQQTDTVMGEEVRRLWQRFWEMHFILQQRQETQALEFQRQSETLQSLNNRLFLQFETSQAIIQYATSEEEVYRILTYALQQVIPLRQILILRLNALEDLLEITWTSPKREDLAPDSYPAHGDPSHCPVIRSGREYKVQNVRQGLLCPSSLSNQNGASYWCVPLLIGGKAVGVVHLVGSAPDCWTDEACAQIQAFSNVAAPMLAHLQHLEKAKRRALIDELTGAYNRRFIEEAMAKMILPGERRRDMVLSVLMIDLDHFKHINDSFGHQVGDLVLKTVASTLHREMKGSDVLARYGGEEFVAVLPQTDTEGAMAVAERLRATAAEIDFRRLAPAAPDRVTISVGVATYPTHAGTSEEIIRKADEALYRAKSLGRNRVVCASDTLPTTFGPPSESSAESSGPQADTQERPHA